MVRLVGDILHTRMGITRGFADGDVVIVDPAMGTGTFLLSVIDSVAATVADEEGEAAIPPQIRSLFGRLIGFEKQTCPFAVAELRIHQALRAQHRTEVPEDEVKFFVADTLDNPYIEQTHLGQTYEPIARSRREANKIKRDVPVLVVIGNPPYRERAKGLGGWVEQGDRNSGAAPPLDAFRRIWQREIRVRPVQLVGLLLAVGDMEGIRRAPRPSQRHRRTHHHFRLHHRTGIRGHARVPAADRRRRLDNRPVPRGPSARGEHPDLPGRAASAVHRHFRPVRRR